jgi:hypothetical protein
MEKPKRRRTDNVITIPNVVPDALSTIMTDRDIAHRAYELYTQRGSKHGHDIIDDWLQAEREVRGTVSVTIPVSDGVKKPQTLA